MSAPILRVDDVPGQPDHADVLYGLPDLSQGTIRVHRSLLTDKNRPQLQELVDMTASTQTELRASLGVD